MASVVSLFNVLEYIEEPKEFVDSLYEKMPVHLRVFTEAGIDLILSDKFELLATWGFGQGFSDILTNAAIISSCKDEQLYNSLID